MTTDELRRDLRRSDSPAGEKKRALKAHEELSRTVMFSDDGLHLTYEWSTKVGGRPVLVEVV